jgi:hypothetical protein
MKDCTFRTGFFGNKSEVFWKQILHKSIINLCFALSSIAAEDHLEQIFSRPVLIGRPLLDIEDDLADCLEVLGEEEVWGIFPEKDC